LGQYETLLARSSPKKLPPRDRKGRFVAVKRRSLAKKTPAKREPAKRLARTPVGTNRDGGPSSKFPAKRASAKPEWVAELEKARLELRRAKRFTKTQQYRELLKSEPAAKTAVKAEQKKLARRIEKLRQKTGGPSPEARTRKQERDREYQQRRRQLSTHLADLFRHGVRVLGTEGADPYLDEYGVTEHVFWVEFRKRYAK
jgi:hypothetical protein